MTDSTPISTAMTLHSQARDDISLAEALEQTSAQLQEAIGLFYSPRACTLGRIDSHGKVEKLQQTKQKWEVKPFEDLSAVFEARLFNPTAELIWLNSTTAENGKAVLVTDTAIDKVFEPNGELNACKALDQSYLVWGKYDKNATDTLTEAEKSLWSIVSTSQIGQLAVPKGYEHNKDFMVLQVREYLVIDDYGNAYVKYERLLNLSWESKEIN
jgi:CRISPR-associated protein (TIGR03984 family)